MRATSASTSSGSRPCADAPLVARERRAGAPRRAARGRVASESRPPRSPPAASRQLGVDVQRRLPAAHEPFAARAQHLADLRSRSALRRGRVAARPAAPRASYSPSREMPPAPIWSYALPLPRGEQERDATIRSRARPCRTPRASPAAQAQGRQRRSRRRAVHDLLIVADRPVSSLPSSCRLTDQSIYIHVPAR